MMMMMVTKYTCGGGGGGGGESLDGCSSTPLCLAPTATT